MGWRDWLGLKPRIEDFARRLIGEFRKQGEEDWIFDASEVILKNSRGAIINLANLFVEYGRATRSERIALLRKYSAFSQISQQPIPKLWELAAKSIYPTVRSHYDRTVTEIGFRDEPKDWPTSVTWPWIGELEIRLVYDWGTHLSQVSEDLAETWGLPLDAIQQRALQNLASLPKPMWESIGNGVYELMTETSYQETLLLIDKVIDQLPFRDSVACIPSNRGVLLACDGNSSDSLVAMIDEAFQRIHSRPWPLTALILTRRNGTWKEFHPEGIAADHAGDLLRLSAQITYEDQKKQLDALYAKQGKDLFVATFGLFRRPADNSAMRSWCSWAEGVHSLLPKTDFVILGRRTGEQHSDPFILSWDRAVSSLGHYMKDVGEYPPRFLVDAALTDAEWTTLLGEGQS